LSFDFVTLNNLGLFQPLLIIR